MKLAYFIGVRTEHPAESRSLNQHKRPTSRNEVTPQERSSIFPVKGRSNRLTAYAFRGEGLCKKQRPPGKPVDKLTYTLLPRRRYNVGVNYDGVCSTNI